MIILLSSVQRKAFVSNLGKDKAFPFLSYKPRQKNVQIDFFLFDG